MYDSDTSHYTDILGPNGSLQTTNLSLVLPPNAGTNGQIISTDGAGNLSWTSPASTDWAHPGTIGSATPNTGNFTSITASSLSVNTASTSSLSNSGNSYLGDAAGDITALKGSLRVYDSDTSNYTDILGPNGSSQTTNLSLVLPTSAGMSGEFLITDGSGNTSWNKINSLQGRAVSNIQPYSNESLMWDSINQTWKPGLPTANIQILQFSEGLNINVDSIKQLSLLNDVVISNNSFFRLTNASSGCDITGFHGGSNGRLIYILNTSGKNQTFVEQSNHSQIGNRLILGTSSKTIGNNQTITLIYSESLSRWVLVSST